MRASSSRVYLAVAAAALGFMVDAYDLLLFNALRVPSLTDLGLVGDAITKQGLLLFNLQLGGMLIGGFSWGVLGDKYGRQNILFGSILVFSAATLSNAFVHSIPAYAVCRFIAGLGLAGEMGAGITLVSELLAKEKRGYGTMIVAASGVIGGVSAGLIGDMLSWRTAYLIGGALGLSLLVLRMIVHESSMFDELKRRTSLHTRGDLRVLFLKRDALLRFIKCVVVGLPMWVVLGFLISFAPELARALKLPNAVTTGQVMVYFNVGLGIGEISSSVFSQWFQTRKKVVVAYLGLLSVAVVFYLNAHQASTFYFCMVCGVLGLGAGYWSVFLTLAVEQFGTDLRSTAACVVPTVVRALVLPGSLVLSLLQPSLGLVTTLSIMFAVAVLLALGGLWFLSETFARDLNFQETSSDT